MPVVYCRGASGFLGEGICNWPSPPNRVIAIQVDGRWTGQQGMLDALGRALIAPRIADRCDSNNGEPRHVSKTGFEGAVPGIACWGTGCIASPGDAVVRIVSVLAVPAADPADQPGVAARLHAIRAGVAETATPATDGSAQVDPIAGWAGLVPRPGRGNGGWGRWHAGWADGGWRFGWHNGGWGNGVNWHNGGWGNGGWGNGAWPNWGQWLAHNFWHNG